MAKDHAETDFDRELDDLPTELRWREWMRRIEAVLFASCRVALNCEMRDSTKSTAVLCP
jgi:hypothetical protein